MCLNQLYSQLYSALDYTPLSQSLYSIFDGARSSSWYRKPIADRCFLASPGLGMDRHSISQLDDYLYRSLAEAREDPKRRQTSSPRRVLIVDDHEDNLMLARYIVEEEGHQVTAVLSGDDAVEMAIAHQPHLILLDIVLGETSGIDIFHQIKQYEQFAQTPVVGITALTRQDVQQEAIAIGFADYLLKPYHIEDLCRIVETYCGVAEDMSKSED